MNLFCVENRNINELIYKVCDPLSLFNLRRCCKHLRDHIPQCCYSRPNSQLFVNNKPIGWNQGKTKYFTDEYMEEYIEEISSISFNTRVESKKHYITGESSVIYVTAGNIDYMKMSSYLNFETYQYARMNPRYTSITSQILKGDNYIEYKDNYFFFRNNKYIVISCIDFDIWIYSRKSLLLEIKDCTNTCIITNHVISGEDYGLTAKSFTGGVFEMLLNIVKEYLKEYL